MSHLSFMRNQLHVCIYFLVEHIFGVLCFLFLGKGCFLKVMLRIILKKAPWMIGL